MGCGCNKNKARYNVKSGGKVVFVTSNKDTATAVANRYRDGSVETLEPAGT